MNLKKIIIVMVASALAAVVATVVSKFLGIENAAPIVGGAIGGAVGGTVASNFAKKK